MAGATHPGLGYISPPCFSRVTEVLMQAPRFNRSESSDRRKGSEEDKEPCAASLPRTEFRRRVMKSLKKD